MSKTRPREQNNVSEVTELVNGGIKLKPKSSDQRI